MKKKIISALVLIGLLVTPMAAYADAAVGDQIVTIGTNLTQQQRQEVLSYFGAKDNAQIIDVDISEERQYLSGKVPDAQIGNSTNSCAMWIWGRTKMYRRSSCGWSRRARCCSPS